MNWRAYSRNLKQGAPKQGQRESPRRAAHHPRGGFVSLASREAPFRRRHVRRPVPHLSHPSGVSAVRASQSPGSWLHPATLQPSRPPPNSAPRSPPVPFPAPSARRIRIASSPGFPPSRALPDPPQLSVSGPFGPTPLSSRDDRLTPRKRRRKSLCADCDEKPPKQPPGGCQGPENTPQWHPLRPAAPPLHLRCTPTRPRCTPVASFKWTNEPGRSRPRVPDGTGRSVFWR